MAYNRWLAHHGVKDQKWGVKNGPPYPLDRSISDGHRLIKSDGSPQGKKKYKTSEKTAYKRAKQKIRTVFVSGSSKTQDKASGYYRKELPKDIQKQLDDHMRKGNRIIVGDAPGIDRQVQDYLNAKKYKNVEIYGPGRQVRYSANSKWKTNPIDDPEHEPGSKEWLAKKDIAMTEAADEGLAIVLDEGAKATRKNVQRLSDSGKGVKVYSLNRDGSDSWEDDWDRKWNTSYASKDVKKANDIYKTLSKQEKYFLTAEENSKRYVSREEYGKKGTNVYSVIEQYKDTPVSVIDIWKNDRGGADVSIAVRNDSNYRHKGYASRALENGIRYFYDHPEIEYLVWGVNSKNRPSIELAKKYGFYLYDKRDDGWETYTLDQKKEVKHTMYNRWLSQDYLAHHGVKGQKWGEKNGPPYPLDSSKSDGHKLLKGDGSPQGKKKYKTSEKTAHKRAERKARTVKEESPEKTAKMQSAKNEDKWELDFLEYIQNEDWADDESPRFDKKRMLKEYSEYLDDRGEYGHRKAVSELFNAKFAKGDPDKFFNRITFGSKAENRKEENDYMEFLKQVNVTKKYKDLHSQQEDTLKELSKAYTLSRDLELQGVKPSDNQYLKQYQHLLKKSNAIYDETKKEACRLLGVDAKKLTGFHADYIDETLYETQLRKQDAATSEKQTPVKPQKKSISSRINSFMDRVFGNSVKAQEKGQQKIDVNYEPVTSEKVKTKRGETYEINDWNGDAQDTIKAFKSNPEPHINVARKAALQEARRIIGWYAKDNPEAQRFLNMSDQQLSKRIGLDFVSAYSHGTVEFSFGDAGTGDFLGHEVDVEYDLNRRKVMNVSVNG